MRQIRRVYTIRLGLVFFGAFVFWSVAQERNVRYSKSMIEVIDSTPEQPKKEVKKTADQWAQELTTEEYHVLRNAGTEPPNGTIYKQFKAQGEGVYYCAGCNAELFTSKEKFESGSGWPSFYAPSIEDNVKLDVDYKIGYKRVEIKCSKCDGHLGHVFEGERFDTPTNKRYCVNGVCLKFKPAK